MKLTLHLPPAHLAERYAYSWSVAIVALITLGLWGLQHQIGVAALSLIYLMGILLCATTTHRWPALLCAALSFLAFKFFFVPPIFTLDVNRTDDLLQLAIFSTTGLVGAGMAVRVREQARAAEQRVNEITAIYELSQAISVELDFNAVASKIATATIQLLPCAGCRLRTLEQDGRTRDVIRAGSWPVGAPVKEFRLQAGGRQLGLLQVALAEHAQALTPDQQRIVETLASQAALALERVRLAQAAARAEALAESDRLKSTLLSAVSHDFRTPLGVITAAANEVAAQDVTWSPAAVREFSLLIRTEAERLNRLVMNLLDLTMLEAGIMRPQIGWYNIAEIVGKVLDRLTLDLSDRPLRLGIPDDLPLVPVDYVQLEQVLWNIVQNALKYSPPGSPLTITATRAESNLRLAVSDRGRGIPPEEREHVFEKFYRLPQPAGAKVPGTGIGLAICKGLVEAHGGSITMHEHAGGGTLVQICLPLSAPVWPAEMEQTP